MLSINLKEDLSMEGVILIKDINSSTLIEWILSFYH